MVVAAEMAFMRENLGYNWKDYKTKTEIISKLKYMLVIEKINMFCFEIEFSQNNIIFWVIFYR